MRSIARAFAIGVWLTSVLAALASLGLLPLDGTELVLPTVVVPGFGTVGLMLTLHRPSNSVGWLMLAMAGVPAVSVLTGVGGPGFQNFAVLVALTLVLVVFPDGKPPSRRWLVPIALLIIGWTSALVAPSIEWHLSNDFGVPVGVAVGLGGVLCCAAAPFARFHRADASERAQLRWLGTAATFTAVTTLVAMVTSVLRLPVIPDLAGVVAVATGALGIPVAISVAITRYRLYDIDRLVSRTVTYALVVLVVGAIYAVPVILLPGLLGESNDFVVASSTLAAAAAFTPVRRRIQRAVDRRYSRARYDTDQEVEALSGRLRGAVDPEAITRDLVDVVARTVAPANATVWLKNRTLRS